MTHLPSTLSKSERLLVTVGHSKTVVPHPANLSRLRCDWKIPPGS